MDHGRKIAGLANIGSNFLIAGSEASRHGTAHPSIAPYEVFECKDGFIMIGAGNEKQVSHVGKPAIQSSSSALVCHPS